MSGDVSPLADFGGRTRLFPLPNLVFFPQVMQPLHIFEPRYREMTADALAGDKLISLVMLKPDWEKDYEAKPATYPVACLGQIVAEQRLSDGRYNLLLRGLSRIRILQEIADDRPFRSADVELLHDVSVAGKRQKALRRQLVETLLAWFPNDQGIYAELKKVLQSGLALGALVDILTFALPLGPEVKQRQLEETHVGRRVENLVGQLVAKPSDDRKFPPEFSVN
jgi:Lon protease-like protein